MNTELASTEDVHSIRRIIPTYYAFFRWLFSWRTLRRGLLAFAGLLTLAGLVYTVENWRGKRAWENCKRELEAKGEVLDWNAYLPPAVPDELNFYKAPEMADWFVGRGSCGLLKDLYRSESPEQELATNTLTEVEMVSANAKMPLQAPDLLVELSEKALTDAAPQVGELILKSIGSTARANQSHFTLIARPLAQLKPTRILLRTTMVLGSEQVSQLFPSNVLAAITPRLCRWQVVTASPNHFRLEFTSQGICAAADYLEWSDRCSPDFALIREAIKRPYAQIGDDYQNWLDMPIPNFVSMRTISLILSQRAQCYLLLNQPEKALQELTLIHRFRQTLELKPAGKPVTLVAAMMNVAISELYAQTIADGMRLNAWREPQLAMLQQQLKEINLPPMAMAALRTERAGICQIFERCKRNEFLSLLFPDNKTERLRSIVSGLVPRGWIYQNMTVYANRLQMTFAGFDLSSNLIRPSETERSNRLIIGLFKRDRPSPYTILAAVAFPNTIRAAATTAQNQTWINEALVVCALERYRMAHEQYPEKLDALVPQFLDKLPHDIIGGQPLHYCRTEPGRFLLYSVGWNEKDDGGIASREEPRNALAKKSDWVWPPQM